MHPPSRVMVLLGALVSLLVVACATGMVPLPISQNVFEPKTAEQEAEKPVDLAVLEFAPTPNKSIEPVAQRIAFLPMLNRGARRIHPMLLDAPSQTLAVFADLEAGLQVVRPDTLESILHASGRPHWSEADSDFSYSKDVLDRVVDLTGAELVVWTEVGPGDTVDLRSHSTSSPRSQTLFPPLRFKREPAETIDRHLYEIPRRLLAQLRPLLPKNDSPAQRLPISTAVYEEALQKANAEMWTGQNAALRRAENRLAQLVKLAPDRPDAWIELAFLRVLRVIATGDEFRPDLMNDGANLARHFAWESNALESHHVARLRFLDHAYVGEADDHSRYLELVESMPAGAPERTLLAWIHEREPKERFGMDPEALPGELGWALSKMASIEGRGPQREWAWSLLQDGRQKSVALRTPIITKQLRRYADSQDHWTLRMPIRLLEAAHEALAAQEIWRGVCRTLQGKSRTACAEQLGSWLHDLDPKISLDEDQLLDDAVWAELEEDLYTRLAEPKMPKASRAALPTDAVGRRDAAFAGVLHILNRLIETSNQISTIEHAASIEISSGTELLIGQPRRLLARGIDLWLGAANQPIVIGSMRGQKKEWEPYTEALSRFNLKYIFGDLIELRGYLEQREHGALSDAELAKETAHQQPYHMGYISSWHRQLSNPGKQSRAVEIESIVPAMGRLLAEAQNLRHKGGQVEEASEGLQALMERRPDSFAAHVYDKILVKQGASPEERLTHLLEAERDFPSSPKVFLRLVKVAFAAERYDIARDRYLRMKNDSHFLKEGCKGLTEVDRRLGRFERIEESLIECAGLAKSKFDAAGFWTTIASIRRDRGDLSEALAANQKALNLVGGASWALMAHGAILELRGEYAQAEARYRRNDEIYEKSVTGRVRLAMMALRRGVPEEAVSIIRELAETDASNRYDVTTTARMVFLAAGRGEEFREFAPTLGSHGLFALAEVEWEVNGDLDRALALIDEGQQQDAEAGIDPCGHPFYTRARILRKAGRFEEGAEAALAAYALDKDLGNEVEASISKIALGDTEWLSKRAETTKPWQVHSWFLRAADEIGRGNLDAAREKFTWASKRLYPSNPSSGFDWAWQLRPLVLLESKLVGKSGNRTTDNRLERDLTFTVNHLPYDGELWEALAVVREHLGNDAGARDARERSLAVWPHRAQRGSATLPASPQP